MENRASLLRSTALLNFSFLRTEHLDSQQKKRSLKPNKKQRRATHFESLEPRLLLSATPFSPDLGAATDIEILYDAPTESLQFLDAGINNLIVDELMADIASVTIDFSDRGESNEHIKIDFSSPFFTSLNINAGEGDDTVVIQAQDNADIFIDGTTITIDDGANGLSTINLTGVEHLSILAGGGNETITIIQDEFTPDLYVSGGAGTDEVVIMAADGDVLTSLDVDNNNIIVNIDGYSLINLADDVEAIRVEDPGLAVGESQGLVDVLSSFSAYIEVYSEGDDLLSATMPFGYTDNGSTSYAEMLNLGDAFSALATSLSIADTDTTVDYDILLADLAAWSSDVGSSLYADVDDVSLETWVEVGSDGVGEVFTSFSMNVAHSFITSLGDIDELESAGIDFDEAAAYAITAGMGVNLALGLGTLTSLGSRTTIRLDQIDGEINDTQTLLADAPVTDVVLGDSAQFTLTIGDQDHLVDLGVTDDNANLQDLLNDISAALATAGLQDTVDVTVHDGRLALVSLDSTLGITINFDDGNAAYKLGFASGAQSTDTLLDGTDIGLGILDASIGDGSSFELNATFSLAGDGSFIDSTQMGDGSAPALSVAASGTLLSVMDIDIEGVSGLTDGTLTLSDGQNDLFTEVLSAPLPQLSDNLDGFPLLSTEDLMSPLDRAASWLVQLTQSSQFDIPLPMVSYIDLGDGLDFASLIQQQLVSHVSATIDVTGYSEPSLFAADFDDTLARTIMISIDGASPIALGFAVDSLSGLVNVEALVTAVNAAISANGQLTGKLEANVTTIDSGTGGSHQSLKFSAINNHNIDISFSGTEDAAAFGFANGVVSNVIPTFSTVQEFLGLLKTALGDAITIVFDPSSNTLNLSADLAGTTNSQYADFDQNMELGGYSGFDVSTTDGSNDNRVEVTTNVDMTLEFGVQVERAGETVLLSASSAQAPINMDGFTFSLMVGKGNTPVEINVTGGANNLDEALGALNAGLSDAGIDGSVEARLINVPGTSDAYFSLVLNEDSGETLLQIYGDRDISKPLWDIYRFAAGQWAQANSLATVGDNENGAGPGFIGTGTTLTGDVNLTWQGLDFSAQTGLVDMSFTNGLAMGIVDFASVVTGGTDGRVALEDLAVTDPVNGGTTLSTTDTVGDFADLTDMVSGNDTQFAMLLEGHVSGFDTDNAANQVMVQATLSDFLAELETAETIVGPDGELIDIVKPGTVTVTGDAVSVFENLSKDDLFALLNEALQFITDANGEDALNNVLPLINMTPNDLDQSEDALSDVINGAAASSITTLQDFLQAVIEQMGIDYSALVDAGNTFDSALAGPGVQVVLGTDGLSLALEFEYETITEVGFGLDVTALAELQEGTVLPAELDSNRIHIADPLDTVAMDVVATGLLAASVTLTYNNDDEAVIALDANSTYDLDVELHEDDLDFEVIVGSTAAHIKGGVIDLIGRFEVMMELGERIVDTTGSFEFDLPIYGTASLSSENGTLNISSDDLEGVLLADDGSVVIDLTEGLDLASMAESPLDQILQNPTILIDGLDRFLQMLQTAIEAPFAALENVPLIGEGIIDAIDPILQSINDARVELNDFLYSAYSQIAGDEDANLELRLREALLDLFGDTPDGDYTDLNNDGWGPRLGLLMDLPDDGNAETGLEDILFATFLSDDGNSAGIEVNLMLGQSLELSLPFEFGFGVDDVGLGDILPGFGFEVDASNGVTLDLSWELRMGFGLSTEDGFFIAGDMHENIADETSDEVAELLLTIEGGVPDLSAELALGLLQTEFTDGTPITAQIIGDSFDIAELVGNDAGFSVQMYRGDELVDTLDFDPNTGLAAAFEGSTIVDLNLPGSTDEAADLLQLLNKLNQQFLVYPGGLEVSADLSQLVSDDLASLVISARDSSITHMKIVMDSADAYGLSTGLTEQMRSISLGFAEAQNAVGNIIEADYSAPLDGSLTADVALVLDVNGEEVELNLAAADLADNEAGMDGLIDALNGAIDLALGEAGIYVGSITASFDGSAIVFTGEGGLVLSSISWERNEHSSLSLQFGLDLVDPDAGDYDNGFDEGHISIIQLVSEFTTVATPSLEMEGSARFHIVSSGSHITDYVEDLIGFDSLGLPSLEFDFEIDVSGELDFSNGMKPNFQIGNPVLDHVEVNAGDIIESLLMPVFEGIHAVLGPVFSVLGDGADAASGLLNTQIPVISQIASVLDMNGQSLEDGVTFNDMLDKILGEPNPVSILLNYIGDLEEAIDDLAARLADGPLVLQLGGWIIDIDKTSPTYIGKIKTPIPKGLGSAMESLDLSDPIALLAFLTGADIWAVGKFDVETEPGGFALDILKPGNILNLIVGETFDIISFNLPSIHADVGANLGFDVDLLSFGVDFGMTLDAELSFVYDSTGFERISESREQGVDPDYADLLDGFYIRTIDGPELDFSVHFEGSGGINIRTPAVTVLGVTTPSILVFGANASIFGSMEFGLDLRDPNEDGALRLDEIMNLTSNFSEPENLIFLFDATIAAEFGFDISVTIMDQTLSVGDLASEFGLNFNHIAVSFSLQDILGSLGLSHPLFDPQLGEVIQEADGNQILRINAGEFDYARIHGDTDDTGGVRNWSVWSSGSTIHISDGQGNTWKTSDWGINTNDLSAIIFRGTNGDDIIDFSGMDLAHISVDARGGMGNDTIYGGAGNDVLIGGSGVDRLFGNGGVDYLLGGDGDDSLYGGDDIDLLVGGEGNDYLYGGAGADRFIYGTESRFDKDTIFEDPQFESVSQAASGQILITSAGHGLSNGDVIYLSGMSQAGPDVEDVVAGSVITDTTNLIRININTNHDLSTGDSVYVTGLTVEGVQISDVIEAEDGSVRIIAADHGLNVGDEITLSDIGGVTGANGIYTIINVQRTSFDLVGTTFDGTYTTGTGRYLAGITNNGTAVEGMYSIAAIGAGFIELAGTVLSGNYIAETGTIMTGVRDGNQFADGAYTVSSVEGANFELLGSQYGGTWNVGDGAFFEEGFVLEGKDVRDAHGWVDGTGNITTPEGWNLDIANVSTDDSSIQLTVFNHGLSSGNLITINDVEGLNNVLSDGTSLRVTVLSNNRIELRSVFAPPQGEIEIEIPAHGLSGLPGNTEIEISGIVGAYGANGSILLSDIEIVNDNVIRLIGTEFSGDYEGRKSLPIIVVKSTRTAAEMNADEATPLGLLTDTLDFSRLRSSNALDIIVGETFTSVSIGSEEVSTNTVTVLNNSGQGSPHQLETIYGSAGDDDYEIYAGPSHFMVFDGGEGSDDYTVYIGDSIEGDLYIHDSGDYPAQDRLFIEGSDVKDVLGLTNQAIYFGPGKSITYSPGGVDSGLELLRADLRAGDDEVYIESTPTTLSATFIGNTGSDLFKVGMLVNEGLAPFEQSNLNQIDGTPLPDGSGPLNLYGFNEEDSFSAEGSDVDRLFIYDVTDNSNNDSVNGTDGILQENLLTGLGMGAGIAFVGMSQLEVRLGQGDDELLVEGTSSATRTAIFGSGGNDTINLRLGPDSGEIAVYGDAPAFSSTIVDTFGDDIIDATGSIGNVYIYGGYGNDTLTGGAGSDVIAGGSGNDIINGGNASDHIYGDSGLEMNLETGLLEIFTERRLTNDDFSSPGMDTIDGNGGEDIIFGDHGWIDTTGGTRSADGIASQIGEVVVVVRAETINETVGQADNLTGGSGNDILFGGINTDQENTVGDVLNGGSNDDILIGDLGVIHFADGTPWANDIFTRMSGLGDNDTLYGDSGNDIIFGGTGADSVDGGDGHDIVIGDQGFVVRDENLNVQTASTTEALIGSGDNLSGGIGNDVIFGGTGADLLRGDDGNDLLLGDHARIDWNGTDILDLASMPAPNFTFTSLHANQADMATGDDEIHGGNNDDIILGQQGSDQLFGGDGDDDIVGGHQIAGGLDGADSIDGGLGHDVIAGDNALILRSAQFVSEEMRSNRTGMLNRLLTDTTLYQTDGTANVGVVPQLNPNGSDERYVTLFDHNSDTASNLYGADNIAGGGGDDVIFGQLGDDRIQGDGSSETDVGSVTNMLGSFEATTDGNDYIEGNGGQDLILGNLGQDDILGGSSNLFGLKDASQRMDTADYLLGGAGTRIARNDSGMLGDEGSTADAHSRDADVIVGDNGLILKPVIWSSSGTQNLGYNYDTYGGEPLIARTISLLDYTIGGAANDIGSGDLLRGGSGDDILHGGTGNDTMFGDGEDDDLYGEHGNDWISGGTGQDGVIGDDGLIMTSRNSMAYGEDLYGIDVLAQTSEEIATPGNRLVSIINLDGALKKTVDLWDFGQHEVGADVDDIIYGGWGSDFLHGGDGDDAISGAEALAEYYSGEQNALMLALTGVADSSFWGGFAPVNPGNILRFDADAGMFADYDPDDPLRKISWGDGDISSEFLLNFSADEGVVDPRFEEGLASDGDDVIFGGLGNDWLVGGSGRDHIYGGLGNDLLNADDDHDSTLGTNDDRANDQSDPYQSYADISIGGAGLDVLIGNTGADRLIDPVGEFNSFIVPFSAFGAFTINRSLEPSAYELLENLAIADGADQTLDQLDDVRASYGEDGMFNQHSDTFSENKGGPRDPQPGNGKDKRDIRVVDVSDPFAGTTDSGILIFDPNLDGFIGEEDQFVANTVVPGSNFEINPNLSLLDDGYDQLVVIEWGKDNGKGRGKAA